MGALRGSAPYGQTPTGPTYRQVEVGVGDGTCMAGVTVGDAAGLAVVGAAFGDGVGLALPVGVALGLELGLADGWEPVDDAAGRVEETCPGSGPAGSAPPVVG